MDKSYKDKIPKKLKDFLEKNKSDSYIPNLDHSKTIKEMNLKEKYNPDNLFKNRTQATIKEEKTVKENVDLVEVKESFFTKFIKKLKTILHIK